MTSFADDCQSIDIEGGIVRGVQHEQSGRREQNERATQCFSATECDTVRRKVFLITTEVSILSSTSCQTMDVFSQTAFRRTYRDVETPRAGNDSMKSHAVITAGATA